MQIPFSENRLFAVHFLIFRQKEIILSKYICMWNSLKKIYLFTFLNVRNMLLKFVLLKKLINQRVFYKYVCVS